MANKESQSPKPTKLPNTSTKDGRGTGPDNVKSNPTPTTKGNEKGNKT